MLGKTQENWKTFPKPIKKISIFVSWKAGDRGEFEEITKFCFLFTGLSLKNS